MMTTNLRFIRAIYTLSRKRNTFLLALLLAILISCDSEDANDCFQTDGDIITYTLDVDTFSKIQMEDDIRVILKEGPQQEVIVETGENLVPDLNLFVEQETLVLQNLNGCNFLREYGRTLVTVTSPNITRIRQASAFEITSEGLLNYESLTIVSNSTPNSLNITDINKSGAVTLHINSTNLVVSANGSSNITMSGSVETASINFSDEFPQFNGRNLEIGDLTFNHTSAAQMVVNPQNSLQGVIKATGDLISVTEPPLVDVNVLFTGQLIFED
ncbi:head GIN domain-containing protein [Dokdonia genika]|uniref:Head GIN domain-containing protein n=1 Tax=Dokdonia genika TaxID=308113 RepID=A0ABV9L4P6_9FLAO